MGRRLPFSSVLAVGLCVVGLHAFACSSGDAPGQEPIANRGSHGRAQLVVTTGAGGQYTTGQARFVRYRYTDAELVDVLVGSEPPPQTLDVCEVSTPDAIDLALSSLDDQVLITHLDAGDVRVSIAGEAADTLSPHHVSPLFPYVGGIEYEELVLESRPLPAASDVSFTALGGRDVGAFDVVGTLPAEPHNVWATPSVTASHLDGMVVGWDASNGPDELLITITEGLGNSQIRCRVADTGRFTVPSSAFEGAPDLDVSSAELWVERVRRAPFGAPGIDWGELEVSVRYVVTTSAL